ncbi:MAG: PKD domain-containing protein [Blastocatellales bacterium]
MNLKRTVLNFSLLALLASFTPAEFNGASAKDDLARREFYRKLAFFHAPILFQDTEIRGQSQDEGNPASVDQPIQRRGDFIARFDFDGDWNGLNNWANFSRRPPAGKNKDGMARAFIYYSIVETETHYFINYCAYHAQDREPRCTDVQCHENDLEGGLHVVRKGPENSGMGTLWMMMYLAHDNWFTYLTPAGHAAGIKLGGKPPHETQQKAHHYNSEFIYDVVWRGVTPDGKLFTPRDPSKPEDPAAPSGTVFRSTIWSEPWGHGMYGWPGPDAKSPYDRYRWSNFTWKDGFIGGDGVIYFPGERPGIPNYNKAVDTTPYALIDIAEPNGLWDRREQIDWKMDGCGGGERGAANCAWGYFGAFRGERWGTDKANAPWRWDHSDDTLPPGMQAYDPLRLVEEFNNLSAVPADQLSRKYTNNFYLGLPEGTRPKRPAPIADIGTRIVFVKPNEPFTLNGARSHTADLEGRGHLIFRWESQAEGFGETVTNEKWIRKTFAREGIYSVKLTVNDGDHSASDQATVIVSSNKLFFDDFQTSAPQAAWRFLGQTWLQRDGLLMARRPGAGLNAAVAADRAYQANMTVEALIRLDLLYEEAREPFGVGVAYQNPAAGNSAIVFGFTGTRRVDSSKDSSRKHMTEVAFYDISEQRRVKLGDSIMTYNDGYKTDSWYHIKLTVEGGERVKAKLWPRGSNEPGWMYEANLPQRKSGLTAPMIVAGTGTSGAASFDYLLVSGSP